MSDGIPGNSNGDAVDVALAVPVPEDEADRGGTSTMWTGSSGVRPDARHPDGSRSLSAGHITK